MMRPQSPDIQYEELPTDESSRFVSPINRHIINRPNKSRISRANCVLVFMLATVTVGFICLGVLVMKQGVPVASVTGTGGASSVASAGGQSSSQSLVDHYTYQKTDPNLVQVAEDTTTTEKMSMTSLTTTTTPTTTTTTTTTPAPTTTTTTTTTTTPPPTTTTTTTTPPPTTTTAKTEDFQEIVARTLKNRTDLVASGSSHHQIVVVTPASKHKLEDDSTIGWGEYVMVLQKEIPLQAAVGILVGLILLTILVLAALGVLLRRRAQRKMRRQSVRRAIDDLQDHAKNHLLYSDEEPI